MPWNKITNCKRCKLEMKIFAIILANGAKMIVEKCPKCGRNADENQPYLPMRDYDWDKLPLYADYSLNSQPCCYKGCENKGTELHHFAPRALFSDADNWPQGFLCKKHHQIWHMKTRTGNYK